MYKVYHTLSLRHGTSIDLWIESRFMLGTLEYINQIPGEIEPRIKSVWADGFWDSGSARRARPFGRVFETHVISWGGNPQPIPAKWLKKRSTGQKRNSGKAD